MPLPFLLSALAGNLPKEPSGRRVGSPKLVKIADNIVRLVQAFPDSAQSAVRAWAELHRAAELDDVPVGLPDSFDLLDFLDEEELPPAITGFSMLIALSTMRWPERAEGLPLPPDLFSSSNRLSRAFWLSYSGISPQIS